MLVISGARSEPRSPSLLCPFPVEQRNRSRSTKPSFSRSALSRSARSTHRKTTPTPERNSPFGRAWAAPGQVAPQVSMPDVVGPEVSGTSSRGVSRPVQRCLGRCGRWEERFYDLWMVGSESPMMTLDILRLWERPHCWVQESVQTDLL